MTVRPKTQGDIVAADQNYQPETVTEKIHVPGIEKLHDLSASEIAEVITNVLRARPNIVAVKYVLGEYFEVTTRPAH